MKPKRSNFDIALKLPRWGTNEEVQRNWRFLSSWPHPIRMQNKTATRLLLLLLFLVLWPFQSGQTTIKRQEITAGDFSFSDLTQRIQEYHFIYSLYMFWSCNMLVYRRALCQRWAFNQTHYLQFPTALLSGKRVQVLNLQDKVTTFDLLCPVSWLFWKQV